MKFFGVEIPENLSAENPTVELAGATEDVMQLLGKAWFVATDLKGSDRHMKAFPLIRQAGKIMNNYFGTEPDCDDGVNVSIARLREETYEMVLDLAMGCRLLNDLVESSQITTEDDISRAAEKMRKILRLTQTRVARLLSSSTHRQIQRQERILNQLPLDENTN